MKQWIKDILDVSDTDMTKGSSPVLKVLLTVWEEDNSISTRTELWTEKEYMENVERGYYERMERKKN